MNKYYKIQTNRVSLRKLLDFFESSLIEDEYMIAPRPLPQENFKYYIAFCKVKNASSNQKKSISFNNHKEISEKEFIEETNNIEHSWISPTSNKQ